jgi:alanine-glyoxylate transaminase/serine-glyoxylate transaminase/serine-pyruvate transaminase
MHAQNPVFIPGPTNIPERLRQAMDRPTWDHRAPDFADFLQPLLNDVKPVFGTTQGEIVIFPSSGSGGLEAALINTLSPGDLVLSANYGVFSKRWIDLCERYGLETVSAQAQWGRGVPVDAFRQALAADERQRIKAVLVCHNETSTGVTSDIAAVRAQLDETDHPALLMVDGISSIASIEFNMDAWGVDVAVAGSQKGFMLATGLAIVAISQKALAAAGSASLPRGYFDIGDMLAAHRAGSFPYTAPVNLLCGLRAAIDMLQEEGLPRVYRRHRRIADGIRKAIQSWGFALCAQEEAEYSNTVSTIMLPEGFDSDRLVRHAYQRYQTSYGLGLAQLAGRAFRIGHLGQLSEADALSGIAIAEMAMRDLEIPIDCGSGVAAAQAFFREHP